MPPALSSIATAALFALASGCAVSAGVGAQGSLGRSPQIAEPSCDSFESCEPMYSDALARAEHCHATDVDCEDEERDVAVSYQVLLEQTHRELDALRSEAEQGRALAEPPHLEPQPPPPAAAPPAQAPTEANSDEGWFTPRQPPPAR